MKKISFLLSLLLLATICFAQQQASEIVEMADRLRSSGKIYVVVTVLMVIFSGIIVYLISIDRKLSRLEKQNKDNIK